MHVTNFSLKIGLLLHELLMSFWNGLQVCTCDLNTASWFVCGLINYSWILQCLLETTIQPVYFPVFKKSHCSLCHPCSDIFVTSWKGLSMHRNRGAAGSIPARGSIQGAIIRVPTYRRYAKFMVWYFFVFRQVPRRYAEICYSRTYIFLLAITSKPAKVFKTVKNFSCTCKIPRIRHILGWKKPKGYLCACSKNLSSSSDWKKNTRVSDFKIVIVKRR
jgi:hypothetical protein